VIIKGKSISSHALLANHLLRADTNEKVEVLELQHPTGDLHATFRDWQELGKITNGKRGIYHANIDPATDYQMTRQQWMRSVEVLERELGLTGQPRVVVLHRKEGREHIHVAWQRTDLERGVMISDSNNYPAHERASLALEMEFGHEHVPGKHAKRDKTRDMPDASFDHAEHQQALRTGVTPQERRALIRAAYEQSDTALAFQTALAEQGYILARGDKRDFVAIDSDGELVGINSKTTGAKAAQLRERMKPLENLPTVAEAKEMQQERRAQEHAAPPAPQETPAVDHAVENSLAYFADLEAATMDRHGRERGAYAKQVDAELLDQLAKFEEQQRFARQAEAKATTLEKLAHQFDQIFRPDVAAEREAARLQDQERGDHHDRMGREGFLRAMEQERESRMASFDERQAEELRTLKAQAEADLERIADAARLRAERERALEAERRLAEQTKFMQQEREGPDRARG
jgi:hypothetical protein